MKHEDFTVVVSYDTLMNLLAEKQPNEAYDMLTQAFMECLSNYLIENTDSLWEDIDEKSLS